MGVERVDYSTEEDYQQALAWEQEQMLQWEQEECASYHGSGVDLFFPDTECPDCHGKKSTPNVAVSGGLPATGKTYTGRACWVKNWRNYELRH